MIIRALLQKKPMQYFWQKTQLKVFQSFSELPETHLMLDNQSLDTLTASIDSETIEAYDSKEPNNAGVLSSVDILSDDYRGEINIRSFTYDNYDAESEYEFDEPVTGLQGNMYFLEQNPAFYLHYVLKKDHLTELDYELLHRIFSRLGIVGPHFDTTSQIQIYLVWSLLKEPAILGMLIVLAVLELQKPDFEKEAKYICKQIEAAKQTGISQAVLWTFLSRTGLTTCALNILFAILQSKDSSLRRSTLGTLFSTSAFSRVIKKLTAKEYSDKIMKFFEFYNFTKSSVFIALLSDINWEAFIDILPETKLDTLRDTVFSLLSAT